MQQIDETAGPLTVQSRLRTLGNRLRARPDTRSLAAPVDAARLAVHDRHEAWLEAHDVTLAGTGGIVFADEVEDDAIAELARWAKALAGGDLGSPLYRRLFAKAMSTLVRGLADGDQAQLANHLIATLPADPAYATLLDKLPALVAARAEVVAAIAARDAAELAESAAWTELQLAEQGGRDAYRDAEPKLQELFPGRKRLVDSFFYQEPRGAKKV